MYVTEVDIVAITLSCMEAACVAIRNFIVKFLGECYILIQLAGTDLGSMDDTRPAIAKDCGIYFSI